MIHVPMWMKLKNVVPSERRQIQKVTYCMIPFRRRGKSIETEHRLQAAWA